MKIIKPSTSGGGGGGSVTSIATAGLISGGTITTTGTVTTSMNTNKLVGRGTAGVGVMEEITLGTNLSLSGTTLNATGGLTTVAVTSPLAGDGTGGAPIIMNLDQSHMYVGDAGDHAQDGGGDITFTQAQRRFTVGDPSGASLGGFLEVDGNGGGMLLASTINAVPASVIFTGSSVSGTGLAVNFGDLADSIAAGAGVRMQVLLNNAGSQNKVQITNGLSNTFFLTDVANNQYGLGDLNSYGNDTRLNVDDANATTRLGAGYISMQTDSMAGTAEIGDVGNQSNGMKIRVNDSTGVSGQYIQMGDVDHVVNSTIFSVNDFRKTIAATQDAQFIVSDTSGNSYLDANIATDTFSFGDLFPTGNGFKLVIDNGNESILLGKTGVGIGKLSIDNIAQTTMLVAGNTAGTSTFPINFVMDASVGSVVASDTSNVFYFNSNQTNSFFGYQAGNNGISGIENAFFGSTSGNLITSGKRNSFFGFQTGAVATTGDGNSLFGWDTGLNLTTGSHNTFLGQQAGNHITTSDNNVAIGYSALFDNVTGADNVAIGVGAGNATLDDNSVFIGSSAGASMTGGNSVIIGYIAAPSFDGTNGLFIGRGVAVSDTASDSATIIGNNADGGGDAVVVLGSAANSGSGRWNTVIGEGSGSAPLTGNGDTIIGRGAGTSITSGSYNTLLGYGTNVSSGARSYGIALGAYANTGSNTLSIGGDDGAGAGYIDQVLIGNNSQNAAPHAVVMSLTSYDTSVTDTSGKDFTFRPGMGTGTHIAGDFVMGAGTSGTTGATGNPNIDANRFNGNSVQTTNNTATKMPIIYPSSDATYTVTAIISARRSAGSAGTAGDSAGYFIRGTFKCIAGTLTQIGTTARDIWEDQAGWDCDFNITSNVLNVQVTGATNNTVQWKVATQFTSIVL